MNRIYYYVKEGDTLDKISQLFKVSIPEIMSANHMKNTVIYTGQKLIIPKAFYYVQEGDSLFGIAKMFRTFEQAIMALNHLKTDQLTVGQKLRVPLYVEAVAKKNIRVYKWAGRQYPVLHAVDEGMPLTVIDVSGNWYMVTIYDGKVGYVEANDVKIEVFDGSKPIQSILGFYTLEEGPTLPSSYISFMNNRANLTQVGLFTYRINRKNPTTIEKFGEFNDRYINNVIYQAHRGNVMVLAVIHNLLYEKGNQEVNKEVLAGVLRDEKSRRTLINNIIKLLERYYFDGVNIDFEDAFQEDSDNIVAFYTELGAALKARKLFFSVSVPARYTDKDVNPFSNPYQYEKIGQVVDEFVVMLYNEHGWPGSGPGPVVGLPWMKQVLDYAITKIPKEKIITAVSVFGFDFNLKSDKAGYATHDIAIKRAQKYNAQVTYDEKSVTPKFSYKAENGDDHEVWFEDAKSIEAKIKVAWDYGIRGIAMWRLGMEDPEVWTMMREDVVVVKS